MSYVDRVSPETKILNLPGAFDLEGGGRLEGLEVAYRSWGRLGPEGDNAVLVCHALTGSADVDEWWTEVLGPGRALDPECDFVVATNVLGGCYGTTGPGTPTPGCPEGLGPDFPTLTIRDQVRCQALLLQALGVRRLRLVVGGSMGGMQALEWAVTEPLPVDSVAALGTPPSHSPWAIGLGEAQRQAIQGDPAWKEGRYLPSAPPVKGLALARAVAMCSYRSPESFDLRFQREQTTSGEFQVESYLRYQGEKLGTRFDANSYLTLSRAMDSHDLARGRLGLDGGPGGKLGRGLDGDLEEVLAGIRPRVLLVGIRSDVLYTAPEIEGLARGIPGAELAWIDSPHGHDSFLMEVEEVSEILSSFRSRLAHQSPEPAAERRVQQCA